MSCAKHKVIFWNFPAKFNKLSKILLGLPALNGAIDLVQEEKQLDDI